MSGATVLVVDDDPSMREALHLLITSAGWEAVAFASAREFLARPRVEGPCCLVLDVNLPDLSGLELQGRVADGGMSLPVIFITGYGDVPMTVRAMKAGAVEFLTKPFHDHVLLDAIREAIARSAAALREAGELRALRERYESLTARERDVMVGVVMGRLNKQVAFDLGISEITVKAHRGSLMRKMAAATFPDLVNMASRLGLKTPGGR